MKKIFKRLVYCSFLSIASIWSFNVEARVTKEVAKAVLPYLMEAAGIPVDVDGKEIESTEKAQKPYYDQKKVKAILDMIYTDEGQKQMVKWAVQDQKPDILAGNDGPFREEWPEESANINKDGEKIFQKLFPCKTGTFTSFTNYSSRLGYIVLKKYESVKYQLPKWIKDGEKITDKRNGIVVADKNTLDYKIARIIFILDIFDDLQQIKDVCSTIPEDVQVSSSKSEYTCRPVSATIANEKGDCVETLYRHLINIAIQDPTKPQLLQTKRLPAPLQTYYNKSLSADVFEIQSMSESGASCVKTHERWKQALEETANFFEISSASVVNLARTLHYIAFWHEDRTILSLGADTPSEESAAFIQSAMNKLANSTDRFIVDVEDISSLQWISTVVEINDTILKRSIKIGICNKKDINFGHAEIISIKKRE